LAEERLAQSEAAADVALGLIASTDPYAHRAESTDHGDALLDAGGRLLIERLAGLSPQARVQLGSSLGDAYAARLLPRRAKRAYDVALAAVEDPRDRLDLRRRRVLVMLDLLESIEADDEATAAAAEAETRLGENDPLAVRLRALSALAALREQDRHHYHNTLRARGHAERALAAAVALPESDAAVRARFESLFALAATHARCGVVAEAERLWAEASSLAEAYPDVLPAASTDRILARRSDLRRQIQDFHAAAEDARAWHDRVARALPAAHPTVLAARLAVERLRLESGQIDGVATIEDLFDDALLNYPATHATVHRAAFAMAEHHYGNGDDAAAFAAWERAMDAADRLDRDGALASALHGRAAMWLAFRTRKYEPTAAQLEVRRDRLYAWRVRADAAARRSTSISYQQFAEAVRPLGWTMAAGETEATLLRRRAAISQELAELAEETGRTDAPAYELTLLQWGQDVLAEATGFTADERATMMRRSMLRDEEAHDPTQQLPDPDDRPLDVRGWNALVYSRMMARRGDFAEADRAHRHQLDDAIRGYGRGDAMAAAEVMRYIIWRGQHIDQLGPFDAVALAEDRLELDAVAEMIRASSIHPGAGRSWYVLTSRLLETVDRPADAVVAARLARDMAALHREASWVRRLDQRIARLEDLLAEAS
jgi:hypothetical protein